MPILRQIKKGLRSRMARCLGKERGAMDKSEIVAFCDSLPPEFDRECSFEKEFKLALVNQVRPFSRSLLNTSGLCLCSF